MLAGLRLVTLLVLVCASGAKAPSPSTSSPLHRALLTLEGLLAYFSQTERKGLPEPKPSHCPCFTCEAKKCTPPICTWCSTLPQNACPKKTSPGCYTTAKAGCICNDPPGPTPQGANSAANFFFSCGQIGGLAPFGTSVTLDKCLCESDWIYSCTNCYR